MSSSDSEDDCYGNIAQKLNQIKSSFAKENLNNIVLQDEVVAASETLTKNFDNTSEIIAEDLNTTLNSTDNDELTLDAIIANNSKAITRGRGRGRGRKRKALSDTSETPERQTRATRRGTLNSTTGRTSPLVPDSDAAQVEHNVAPFIGIPEPVPETAARGRGRGGRRAKGSRGWARGHGRTRRELWAMFDNMFGNTTVRNPANSSNYPTYSVGNTDEYPDQSDNQQLFAARPAATAVNDVEIIEDADPLDDENEEMSVKVYWQSLEVFKFKIRKYQKLTQIFEYFTKKEQVSNNKLLFTYNDRILKIDDTPDSINYSIAKFIDGGIVNQTLTYLAQEPNKDEQHKGLKIKFQCQGKKKPFETTLSPEDKLALPMMKCAEHLEMPIERLKFYFDGDLITSKNTPQDLELEGGECIDVKITSS